MDIFVSFLILEERLSFFTMEYDVICGLIIKKESEVAQSCLTLCNPMDCSLPDFSVHGLFQARILEWVIISFSRDLSDPGIEPGSPALEADALTSEPPGKRPLLC